MDSAGYRGTTRIASVHEPTGNLLRHARFSASEKTIRTGIFTGITAWLIPVSSTINETVSNEIIMKTGLIIFIRNPVKGKVKTRLAQTIGDEKTFLVYSQLLVHTHQVTSDLSCDKFIYYSDEVVQDDIWKKGQYYKRVQQPGDLGERMAGAFRQLFNQGYNKILIIGSDCIALNGPIISKGFDLLNTHEVVIGPAEDGGYYLLGMTKYMPALFFNKKWGTASVLDDTLQDISGAGIRPGKLAMLNDIDEEKDLTESLRQLL